MTTKGSKTKGSAVKPVGAVQASNRVKKVVVLLGDIRLYDPVAPGGVWDADDIETIDLLKKALGELKDYEFSYLDNHKTLLDELRALKGKVDLAFNLLDEGYYNDPRKELHVAALLEILGIPYTGATPQSMAIRLDKAIMKGVARQLGVPVAKGLLIDAGDPVPDLDMAFPVFVKPNNTDAGQGISRKSVCCSLDAVKEVVADLRKDLCKEMPILVEEFLPGKDLTIGVLGNPGRPGLIMLPIAEEDYSMLAPELPRICGQESKWDPTSPYWKTKSIKAILPPETEKIIVEGTKRMFKYLECKDYARFDWRLDANGQPKLLDANANPGWCWDSHMVKLSAMIGLTYPQMLGKILAFAIERNAFEASLPCKLYKP
jgi:D-alanine-D-alanine ligase